MSNFDSCAHCGHYFEFDHIDDYYEHEPHETIEMTKYGVPIKCPECGKNNDVFWRPEVSFWLTKPDDEEDWG